MSQEVLIPFALYNFSQIPKLFLNFFFLFLLCAFLLFLFVCFWYRGANLGLTLAKQVFSNWAMTPALFPLAIVEIGFHFCLGQPKLPFSSLCLLQLEWQVCTVPSSWLRWVLDWKRHGILRWEDSSIPVQGLLSRKKPLGGSYPAKPELHCHLQTYSRYRERSGGEICWVGIFFQSGVYNCQGKIEDIHS